MIPMVGINVYNQIVQVSIHRITIFHGDLHQHILILKNSPPVQVELLLDTHRFPILPNPRQRKRKVSVNRNIEGGSLPFCQQ